MLQAVISRSVMSTRDPIDRIEVIDGGFVVTAGSERLVLQCVWINGVSGDGRPLLGSGAWIARTDDDEEDLSPGYRITSRPKHGSFPPWRIFKNWFQRRR